MKRPITQTDLEGMLRKMGTAQPAAPFYYTPRPAPLPFFKGLFSRCALVLSAVIAVLLAIPLLLLPLSQKEDGTPRITDPPVHLHSGSDPTHPDQSAPITTAPPGDEPPVTDEPPILTPVVKLPTSYGVSHLSLNMLMTQKDADSEIQQIKILETDNFDSINTIFSVRAASDDSAWVSASFAKVRSNDSAHVDCQDLYYDLKKSEFYCVRHKLEELLKAKNDPTLPTADELVLYQADIEQERCIFWTEEQPSYYYYIVDFKEGTVLNSATALSGPDTGYVSPDFSYMVIREMGEGGNEYSRIQNLLTGESLIPYDTPVYGDPQFSADGRIFLRRCLKAENDIEFIAFDTVTGTVTPCKGEFCYFSGNTVLTRTEDGFWAYDCTSGQALEDHSLLPFFVEAKTPFQYGGDARTYTLKLYDPQTGALVRTISEANGYVISDDGNWLYIYHHKEAVITCYSLVDDSSFTVPLSDDFLKAVSTETGYLTYRLTVSADRSILSIGYTVTPKAEVSEDALIQAEAQRLSLSIQEIFEQSHSLADFLERFAAHPDGSHTLIRRIAADLYDEYVIWQVEFQSNAHNELRTILRIVEDYRDGSLTMYYGNENPNYINGVSGGVNLTQSYFPNHELHIRKTTDLADRAASQNLLEEITESIGCRFDYGKCYDENGKWNDALARAYLNSPEYLRVLAFKGNFDSTPASMNTVLDIILRNPRVKSWAEVVSDDISNQKTASRGVAQIYLYDETGKKIYSAEIVVAETGRYFLREPIHYGTAVEISREDYLALMEIRGGFPYTSGLYLDDRIATIQASTVYPDTYDFFMRGTINHDQLYYSGILLAEDRYHSGDYTAKALLKTLFNQRIHTYIELLVDHQVSMEWSGSYLGYTVSFTLTKGELMQLSVTENESVGKIEWEHFALDNYYEYTLLAKKSGMNWSDANFERLLTAFETWMNSCNNITQEHFLTQESYRELLQMVHDEPELIGVIPRVLDRYSTRFGAQFLYDALITRTDATQTLFEDVGGDYHLFLERFYSAPHRYL